MKLKIGNKEYEVTKHSDIADKEVYVVKTEKRTYYIDNGTANDKNIFLSAFGRIKGYQYFKKENEVFSPIGR